MPGGTVRMGSEEDGASAPPDQSLSELAPGTLLDGRYRIAALLGTGGMGSVYAAEHEAIGRRVAVKVLHAEHCASAAERERFRREARVAVRLRSPHVVEILDFGEDSEGRLFLVMELLEGEPVKEVLAREGRLAPSRVVRLLRQLLAGLEAAHGAGIVHRDLKPENLWLSGSGPAERLKLLDFGIAKWTGPAPDGARTQAGLVIGTPEYLAPEQAVGGEVDHRADLYSVGILTYVLLTGRHPFDTTDVRGLLAAHAYRRVPSPATCVPELAAHPRLLELVARATEKDRARRPGSARELLALLEGAEFPLRLANGPAVPPHPSAPPALLAARASLLGVPAAATPDLVNVTLVRVQVRRWESWAPAASPVMRALHLAAHDALVLPVVRGFGGRRILAAEGGSLFAFRSPTDAVHCAAAVQDLAVSRARTAPEVERLELQIAAHQGEVHLSGAGAAGAPLEVARDLASVAAVGEVWFTRPVYLTMSRSEAPAEEMGARAVGGLPEPVMSYRLVRVPGALPYGGRHAWPAGRAGPRRLRLLEPALTALDSIRVAGETEGKAGALARVLAWGLALAIAGGAEAAAGGLHAALMGAHRRVRRRHVVDSLEAFRPWALDRLLVLLERIRRAAATRTPAFSLALRRPRGGAAAARGRP